MHDSENPQESKSLYRRAEAHILQRLPAFITPLRFRILLGYLVVLLLTVYGWEHLASAWSYLLTLLAPTTALLGALMALKLSVVFVSLFTLLVSILKFFFGFLIVVLKPGILKAIFIPQLFTLVASVHRKSEGLQNFVKMLYSHIKTQVSILMNWWRVQYKIDKLLLSGFLAPMLIILLVVFIIKRAVAIFAVKKLSEQVVQKTTKYVIKNFHKLPVVGTIPNKIANAASKLTAKEDRENVADDFKQLTDEIYHSKKSNSNNQTSSQ